MAEQQKIAESAQRAVSKIVEISAEISNKKVFYKNNQFKGRVYCFSTKVTR